MKPCRHLLGLRGTPKESSSYGWQWVQGRAKKRTRSGLFEVKNKAQTLTKLQNNFEKVQKMTFLTQKMVKNDLSKQPKWAKFWPKNSIFGVIYRPLELKIHPRVGPLRPKTKPKHFLNKSKTTLKKSRKWLFGPTKWSKMTPQNRQNEHIFDRKSRFLRSFIDLQS